MFVKWLLSVFKNKLLIYTAKHKTREKSMVYYYINNIFFMKVQIINRTSI